MSTVLVTGASTGVGLALGKLLKQTDHTVVLTAREQSLARFADAGIVETERVWLRPLDVTEDGGRRAVIDEIEKRLRGVDVLINNAGVAYRSVVEHVTEQERLEQMGINFRSPMEMARLVLPSMRRKRAGRIINVSSVGGMMAMPTMSVYSASKFALEGATESLYYEVRPWNIKVSLIEPGFIHSSSFQRVHYTSLGHDSETEFLFRVLFCVIFIGLGGEHLFKDDLIRLLMPSWVPLPRLVSIACGLWLVSWGGLILLGWQLRWAAYALGAFVIGVTALVHGPALLSMPAEIPADCGWMWDILQRSNFVKNLCLLGVCFHLLHHETGRLSLESFLENRGAR